jgi:predicted O-methyltransferase YrrM
MNNKDKLYKMRNDDYHKGLLDLIDYLKKTSNTQEMTMIEIGSYAGESTKVFAKNFKKVISVDPFQNDYDSNDIACSYMDLTEVYNEFISNIKDYDNITHIRKTSDDAIEDLRDVKVDFVYIDGLHTYDQVKKDIENYQKIVRENGFIGGHDYHIVWRGVIDAVDETLGKPDKKFQDTSWIKKI